MDARQRYHARMAQRRLNRELLWRRLKLSSVFGLLYLTSLIVDGCCDAGSEWKDGIQDALWVGAVLSLFTYPVILFVQWLAVSTVLWLIARRSVKRMVWEFVPISVVSLVILGHALCCTRTEAAYFRRFVADRKPASVSDMVCWHRSRPRSSKWVMRFGISPDDLGQVLTRYPFIEAVDRDGFDLAGFAGGLWRYGGGLPIPPPAEPMVYSYKYAAPDGLRLEIYMNEGQDVVYVMGVR